MATTCFNPDCDHVTDDPSNADDWISLRYNIDGHTEYWCSPACFLAAKGIVV